MSRIWQIGVGVVLGLLWAAPLSATGDRRAAPAPPAPDLSLGTAETHRQFFTQYCVGCHQDRSTTAGRAVTFDKVDVAAVAQRPDIWERVVRSLRAGHRPPAAGRRPDPAAAGLLASWLERELDRAASAAPDPGRAVGPRRLTRTEYTHVVRDLLGLTIPIADELPPDPPAPGADAETRAAYARVASRLMEAYLPVATRVARVAVGGAMPSTVHTLRIPKGTAPDGRFEVTYPFPVDATYTLAVAVMGEGPAEVEVTVDGERVGRLVPKPGSPGARTGGPAGATAGGAPRASSARVVEWSLPIRAGERQVVAIVEGRPVLDRVAVTGPVDPTGRRATESRRRIFTCYPKTRAEEDPCARTILTALLRRGLRRAPADADMTFFLGQFKEGRAEGDFERGIEQAVRALLLSPELLYRFETAPPGVAAATPYKLRDFELASRLSFLVWHSQPDDQLLAAAAAGSLKDPAVLEKQARRLLADRRAAALARSLADRERNPSEAVPLFDAARALDRSVLDLAGDVSPERFVRTVIERLLTDALGRDVEWTDAPAVRKVLAAAEGSRFAFSSLVVGLVKSVPFTMRRSAEDPAAAMLAQAAQ